MTIKAVHLYTVTDRVIYIISFYFLVNCCPLREGVYTFYKIIEKNSDFCQ